MAEDVQNRITARGMTPGSAFFGQPQTGVVERLFCPLEQPVLCGRVSATTEDPRDAVRAFIARDTPERLSEKNGHPGPQVLRRQHGLATLPIAAQPDRVSKVTGPVQPLQTPQPDRDHGWAPEARAAGRHPLRQMPEGLPLCRRPRRNRHVLAMKRE